MKACTRSAQPLMWGAGHGFVDECTTRLTARGGVQDESYGSEWGAERVLVQGPTVNRSFRDRAADAFSSSDDDSSIAYPSGKVSFIRNCLQARSSHRLCHDPLCMHCFGVVHDAD